MNGLFSQLPSGFKQPHKMEYIQFWKKHGYDEQNPPIFWALCKKDSELYKANLPAEDYDKGEDHCRDKWHEKQTSDDQVYYELYLEMKDWEMAEKQSKDEPIVTMKCYGCEQKYTGKASLVKRFWLGGADTFWCKRCISFTPLSPGYVDWFSKQIYHTIWSIVEDGYQFGVINYNAKIYLLDETLKQQKYRKEGSDKYKPLQLRSQIFFVLNMLDMRKILKKNDTFYGERLKDHQEYWNLSKIIDPNQNALKQFKKDYNTVCNEREKQAMQF